VVRSDDNADKLIMRFIEAQWREPPNDGFKVDDEPYSVCSRHLNLLIPSPSRH